ncbi:uncharacterized protein LOC113328065 [Papaver somniferum]|uniref:uncharacterized protein LOC113328065 n=1 Tax=Papaver somniferum TaxID=3469 RepID=UPI000E6F9B7C|nr:uncharacterized protein LOC113328065 [Papaver somniferum]
MRRQVDLALGEKWLFLCEIRLQENETPSHVLMECNLARAVWFSITGWSADDTIPFSVWTQSWFDDLHAKRITINEICRRAIITWCLWYDRCDKAFQNSNPNLERTILRARSFISDHLKQYTTQHVSPSRVCRSNIHWTPPPLDVVTINIDGSFSYLNNIGGIGLMCRNFASEQQAAECIYLMEIRNASQAECMGLWEAVNLAERLKLEKVYFQLDAKVVVEAVNNNTSIDWQLLNLVKDIQSFFGRFLFWKCSYISKEGNKVADTLSKLARDNALSVAWSGFSPVEIRSQLSRDKTYVLN